MLVMLSFPMILISQFIIFRSTQQIDLIV